MTATALSVASVHLTGINASRKKSGLPALTLVEVEREFDVDNRSPLRKAVAPRTTSNTVAADSMWGGIVTRLNATLPSNRTPIAAVRTSPASSAAAGRVDASVDWAGLAHQLNTAAGLRPPSRSRAR